MTVVNNIIYLVCQPFTDRDYSRFGVDVFINRDIEVNVIDCFDVFYPEKNRCELEQNTTTQIDVSHVNSLAELYEVLDQYLENTTAILILPVNLLFEDILEFLNFRNIKVITFLANILPAPYTRDGGVVFSIMYKKFLDNAHKIQKNINYIIQLASFKKPISPRIDYFFYGGKKAKEYCPSLLKKSKRKISLHAFDYDLFLYEESCKYEQTESYILFLDQYLPFHPDHYLEAKGDRVKNDTIINSYYEILNRYFDELEQEFGIKVVIAAHPRAKYESNDRLFNSREVLYDSIANLVKYSDFCVTHWSTAVNLVVLYEKPLILTYMEIFNKIVSPYNLLLAKGMARELMQDFVLIDQESKSRTRPKMDRNVYRKYLQNYIKSSNCDGSYFWEVVARDVYG